MKHSVRRITLHPLIWWVPFRDQLALLACDYGLDTRVDRDFDSLMTLFIQLSKLN